MPIRAADIAKNERKVTVKTDVGDCIVKYKPHIMTPARQQELNDAFQEARENGEDTTFAMLTMYCDVVSDWDVEGPLYSRTEFDSNDDPVLLVEEGKRVPLEVEYLEHMSMNFLNQVLEQVQDDMSPDPKAKPKRSGSFSR